MTNNKNVLRKASNSIIAVRKAKLPDLGKRSFPSVREMDSVSIKFKTELCKKFMSTGTCDFENMCAFAHGRNELKRNISTPKLYKTRNCKSFFIKGICPYGLRCQFSHAITPVSFAKRLEQMVQIFNYKNKVYLHYSTSKTNSQISRLWTVWDIKMVR
jgi:hypothetical protein